jgi:hypothetical protein
MKSFKTISYDVFNQPKTIMFSDGTIVHKIKYSKEYSSYYKIKNHCYA